MAGQQYYIPKKRQSNVSALGLGVTTITLAKTWHLCTEDWGTCSRKIIKYIIFLGESKLKWVFQCDIKSWYGWFNSNQEKRSFIAVLLYHQNIIYI